MAKKAKNDDNPWRDPNPYDGPIERADGTRPYNRFLWNSEWWWANRELGYHISSRWEFGIVHLWDGTFSTNGFVSCIERNNETYPWETRPARPCVFPTRTEAIRTAAARRIREARNARKWTGHDSLQGERLALVVNWIRAVVARETGKPEPAAITVYEPPKPRPKTGLPLFDF